MPNRDQELSRKGGAAGWQERRRGRGKRVARTGTQAAAEEAAGRNAMRRPDPAPSTPHAVYPLRRGSRFATAIERPQGPDTLLTAHLLESPKLQAPPAPEAGLLFVGPLGTPPGGPALA